MPRYIKHGKELADEWTLLRPDEQGELPAAPLDADVIVPLAAWLADAERWSGRRGRVGVWLAPDDDPALLQAHLPSLSLVAIDFPSFTDGRGYSLARLLRERYHFSGELRAVGDVWQDLIHPLWQVGFDAFQVKEGKTLNVDSCYNTFSDSYQVTFRQPQPLFRRRVTQP